MTTSDTPDDVRKPMSRAELDAAYKVFSGGVPAIARLLKEREALREALERLHHEVGAFGDSFGGHRKECGEGLSEAYDHAGCVLGPRHEPLCDLAEGHSGQCVSRVTTQAFTDPRWPFQGDHDDA